MNEPHVDQPGHASRASESAPRGVVLVDLRCAQCGYDVKGLPIDGACPECGAPVRPTVLAYVDMESNASAGLIHPRRAGVCAVIVALLVLLAAGAVWLPDLMVLMDTSISDVSGSIWRHGIRMAPYSTAGVMMLLAVAFSFGFSPQGREAPEHDKVCKGLRLARLTMVALALALFAGALADQYDVNHASWTWDSTQPLKWSVLRLVVGAIGIVLALAMSPVLTFLGRKSRRHRIGVSSRQGIPAIIVSLAVVMIGAGLAVLDRVSEAGGWVLPGRSSVTLIAPWLMVIGCVMLTIGLMNLVWDAIRIARGLSRRRYLPEDIVG